MRIVDIQEQTIRLTAASRNSSISFDDMTASALVVRTDAIKDGKPLMGLAFDSIGRYGHGELLRERFIPRLLLADPSEYSDPKGGIDPDKAWAVAMRNEKPGGHGERPGAVGLLDAAFFDLAAKCAGLPLWAFLARQEGREPSARIAIYASGGHYRQTRDVEALCDDIQRAMDRGHRRFKIKIGGEPLAVDIKRIESVLRMLEPGMSLAVDGNGTFSLSKALNYADALAGHSLAWIEEPLPPLDYELHREFAERSLLPLATGENLFSADDARNLLRHGGLRSDRDVVQFDVSLSYGIPEYRRILDEMARQGWERERCSPHAGHLLAFNVVAGLGLGSGEAAIDENSLFGRITAHLSIADGVATLPDLPGTGLEQSPAYDEIFSGLIH